MPLMITGVYLQGMTRLLKRLVFSFGQALIRLSGQTERERESTGASHRENDVLGKSRAGVMREGPAQRVIFFYPSEEGTYVDNVLVTLYENGVFFIQSELEDTTAHVSNAEILWSFASEPKQEDRSNIRLLKPGREGRIAKGNEEVPSYSSMIQKEFNDNPPGLKSDLSSTEENSEEALNNDPTPPAKD